jgi:hypothetical protein
MQMVDGDRNHVERLHDPKYLDFVFNGSESESPVLKEADQRNDACEVDSSTKTVADEKQSQSK